MEERVNNQNKQLIDEIENRIPIITNLIKDSLNEIKNYYEVVKDEKYDEQLSETEDTLIEKAERINEGLDEMRRRNGIAKEKTRNTIYYLQKTTKFLNEFVKNMDHEEIGVAIKGNELIDTIIDLKQRKACRMILENPSQTELTFKKIDRNCVVLNSKKQYLCDLEREQFEKDKIYGTFFRKQQIVMKLFVKTLTGVTLDLNVFSNELIEDVKKDIYSLTGNPPDQQRFIFAGQQLEDEKTLLEYNIENGSTIHMALRLRGGKPVIILYDNEIKEKEEVTVKLKLNEAMDIGTTYPKPEIIKEEKKEKEFEWKGTYSSDAINNCQIHINNKQFDYIFWEGICLKNDDFKGDVIGISNTDLSNELHDLLMKLGLNERETNDFIVYWLTKLSNRTNHKVTICDSSYDNEIAPLSIPGFNHIHRVMLKFEEVESIDNLPSIHSIQQRNRPFGKYVIEWGAILA